MNKMAEQIEASVALSLVVPVYNEQEAIIPFLERVMPILETAKSRIGHFEEIEVLFVNDGSTDLTQMIITMKSSEDPSVKLINLSRNFGKEAALHAGLHRASGRVVIPIDVDLQDPPEVILEMIDEWQKGAKVVNGKRADRTSDQWFKRASADWFYRIFNKIAEHPIPAHVGDFRLLDREVIDILKQLNETSRFNKGLFSWVGFEVATVEYERDERTVGSSKWPIWRLWNLALDGIISSSTAPLRIWTYIGSLTAVSAFCYALYLILSTLIFGVEQPGYASLMVAVLFFGGINLLCLGIVGEYLGRVANEVRGRPPYIIDSQVGME